jgi:hypothetical protein
VSGAAQTASVLPQSSPPSVNDVESVQLDAIDWTGRLEELRAWVAEFSAWQEWSDEWLNKREPGWFGARARRQKPDPPVWLDAECSQVIEAEGVLLQGCDLIDIWKDPNSARLRDRQVTTRLQRESPTNTRWWEHVHLDLFWPMTQLGTSAYGVVGTHVTMEVTDRFQIFVAPGAMLMNLPTKTGARRWTPATDWGFSFRIVDFQIPGYERLASLHVNVAKAWILAGSEGFARSSIDLAGFSITFAKNPPPAQ